MKSILGRVVVVLMVGALTCVAALAKVQKHKVKFENDVKVNSTVLKKGTYEIKFDDQTGQFSVLQGNKVMVETTAKLEPRTKKAGDFQLRSLGTGDETQLVGVTFGGSDKDIVIVNGGSTVTGN